MCVSEQLPDTNHIIIMFTLRICLTRNQKQMPETNNENLEYKSLLRYCSLLNDTGSFSVVKLVLCCKIYIDYVIVT